MATKMCVECSASQKAPRLQRCWECWLARQPIETREQWATWRLESVPESLRVARVPQEAWPPGRRWCAGCQSFVRFSDCGKTATRCKTCVSTRAHGSMVQRVYNITKEEYAAKFKEQGGRCAICRGRPQTVRLAQDHNHKTGKPRGLLCSRCNHDLLGAAHDSIHILRRAVAYMEQYADDES